MIAGSVPGTVHDTLVIGAGVVIIAGDVLLGASAGSDGARALDRVAEVGGVAQTGSARSAAG